MPDNDNDTAQDTTREDAPSYVVVGAGAQINTVDGTATLVTRGGPVPSNVDPDHLRHLLDLGLVAEADPVGGLEATLTGDHTVVVTAPVEGLAGERLTDLPVAGAQVPAGPPTDAEADGNADGFEDPPPAKSDPKSVWVNHAVFVGEDRDTAEAMTKEQLVEKYGRA